MTQELKKTFRNFNPDTPFIRGDLSDDSTFNEIIKTIGDTKVNIIAGGPPCQGFSMFGNRRFIKSKNHNPLEDNRNDLVFTFLKYVEKIKPNWFIMENVAGFINLNNGFYLEEYIKKVESIGYKNYVRDQSSIAMPMDLPKNNDRDYKTLEIKQFM